MELVYLWIDGYKNLNNKGFVLNPVYEQKNLSFQNKTKTLNIKVDKRKNFVNIFGDKLNVITIVGKNGSGKSNYVNALSHILRAISPQLKEIYDVKELYKNQKFKDIFEHEVIYDAQNLPNKFCLILKQNTKYYAYCSKNLKPKITIMVDGDLVHPIIARYVIKKTQNSKSHKVTNIRAEAKRINVAKFQPFLREEDTYPLEFPQWNGIEDITRIKLDNYFYYDRFRLYDAVRSLKELNGFNNKNQLEIFKSKKSSANTKNIKENNNLYFSHFGPYLNLYDGLQWVNQRVQKEKDDTYDITKVISASIRNICVDISKQKFKTVEDILESGVLHKFFFAYALGRIFEILKNTNHRGLFKTKYNKIIQDIKSLNLEDYTLSLRRVNFYKKMLGYYSNSYPDVEGMLNAYIDFEKNDNVSKILKQYYKIYIDYTRNNGTTLELNYTYLQKFNSNNRYADRILKVQVLKGISENLYIENNGQVYDFMSLSTGEQRILRFFADVFFVAKKMKSKTNIFIFDEMDLSWHPEWQRCMIFYIKDLFDNILKADKDRKINLIFTTHSPFILSDMPKENVIYIDNAINNSSGENTFAANIHDLFKNNFFDSCNGCTIGKFAASEITKLYNKMIAEKDYTNSKIKEFQYIINSIGEPIIKNQLQRELNKHKVNEKTEIEKLYEQISKLEEENKILRGKNNETT